MSQDRTVKAVTRSKVKHPFRGQISFYWSRLTLSVFLVLTLALNSQAGAQAVATPQAEPAHTPTYLKLIEPMTKLPETPLKPIEPLQTVYVSPLRDYGTYSATDTYAAGNCTYYVASRLPVPGNWGNANMWAYNASLSGHTVSITPIVGAVAQTAGDSYLGHVAIVEAVNPDGSFVISEMNAQGLGVIDSRTTTTAEFPNFIYF